jgi:formamidopyrimidine-DNA glycosylase
MPELPEVEVIVQELRRKLPGEKISRVDSVWHKTVVQNNYTPNDDHIISVDRHGKYIIIRLSRGYILVHLRMTGQLMVNTHIEPHARHLRAVIYLQSGRSIQFFDSRKFGRIFLTGDPDAVLKNTGIDALSDKLTVQKFRQMIMNRKTIVKSFLMDQRHITGLGNIYIDESLFAAGIHPLTRLDSLGRIKIGKLYTEIQNILQRAIQAMGTTISDYKTVGGGFGGFQNYLAVYGRENKPCRVCNTPIEKIRINNRGTHFCPACQKLKN